MPLALPFASLSDSCATLQLSISLSLRVADLAVLRELGIAEYSQLLILVSSSQCQLSMVARCTTPLSFSRISITIRTDAGAAHDGTTYPLVLASRLARYEGPPSELRRDIWPRLEGAVRVVLKWGTNRCRLT